jgi:hypothetical protein
MLEVWGKQPLGRKEVIRKIGELMVLREAVNFRGGGLEDTPEVCLAWNVVGRSADSLMRELRYIGLNRNLRVSPVFSPSFILLISSSRRIFRRHL